MNNTYTTIYTCPINSGRYYWVEFSEVNISKWHTLMTCDVAWYNWHHQVGLF